MLNNYLTQNMCKCVNENDNKIKYNKLNNYLMIYPRNFDIFNIYLSFQLNQKANVKLIRNDDVQSPPHLQFSVAI